MKKLQSLILALSLFAIGLTSCEKEVVNPLQIPVSEQISTSSSDLLVPDGGATIIVDQIGTVMRVEGTYIISSQGKTYLPNNLSEDFQAHKLKVFFVGKIRSNAAKEDLIPIELIKISATDKPIELPDISSRTTAVDRINR